MKGCSYVVYSQLVGDTGGKQNKKPRVLHSSALVWFLLLARLVCVKKVRVSAFFRACMRGRTNASSRT